jgi:hypothetical protein
MGIDEVRGAGPLVNGHAGAIQMLPESRMCAYIPDDLAYARKQPSIIECRLAHRDSVLAELASFSQQPGGMRKSPHRNRSVICRHAPKLVAR